MAEPADTALPVPDAATAEAQVLRERLSDVFTRSFFSAAGYVFESQPYVGPDDTELLEAFTAIRREDQRHARMLAGILDRVDAVPETGAFPYWYWDLNYLTVPFLGAFVLGAIEQDVKLLDDLLATWPDKKLAGRASLEAIRRDKRAWIERLKAPVAAARVREAASYRAAADEARQQRKAKAAKAKAAAAPKAAAAAPTEKKLTPKERARQAVMRLRGHATPAAPAAAGVDVSHLPDPDEAGISPKEKAKRQMARMRAQKAGVAAPAAAPAPAASALPDPDEPGISPKEKAKRTMMRMRAQQAGGGAAAAPAPAAPPAPALLDPDEPGISPKEKARRQIAKVRAEKK
jgi:hypothetical protein